MKYSCVEHFNKVFIEIPNDWIELDEIYLVYNDTYYMEATEYFYKFGLTCTNAFIEQGDEIVLHLVVKDTLDVKALYKISEDIKISVGFDDENEMALILAIPL